MDKKKTKRTQQSIDNKLLLEAIENICLSCYGVKNLASHSLFNNKKRDLKQCIFISKTLKGDYKFKIYVVLNSYVKITEIINEMQKRIIYEISKCFKINVLSVDIYVQNIE